MEYGLVQTATAAEVIDQENAATEDTSVEDIVVSLSSHIDKKWTLAKEGKEDVEGEMIKWLHQRAGKYDPAKLAEITAAKQPPIFMNITDTKCRNASAWIKDILLLPTGRIFGVDPTPIPELPDETTQQIQETVLTQYLNLAMEQAQITGQPIQPNELKQMISSKAEEIKKKVKDEILKTSKLMAEEIANQVDDDWIQGGFYKALEDVIDDIVGLHAGIVKGPVYRKVKRKKTTKNMAGQMSRQITEEVIPEYERRSPFSIFPSPRSTGVNSGYLFDVIILKPKQLYNLIGTEGYKEEEIRAVIREFNAKELSNEWIGLSENAKEGLGENLDDHNGDEENIYCLELWDELPGSLLLEWGLSVTDIPDPEDIYPCCVWKIDKHVIKAMLNYDQLGRKPFHKACFQNANDSFWGGCVPEKIADCQQICNACARSILSNIGMGALPQVELNIDRLEPNASRDIIPGKIWPVTEEQMQSGVKALNFYQPAMVTPQLMQTYQTFSKIADEHSGVPAWAHGDSAVGGAGSTSSGLAQLIQQAARGIKAVIRNIDNDIIIPALEYHYDYLLENQQIYGLVGDYKISAKGTAALLAKEQMATKKIEYLTQTSNPVDLQLVGLEARRKMLQDTAVSLGLDIELPPIPEQPQRPQPQSPAEAPQELDPAGNPVGGTETRQFNPQRPRLQASTSGNPGGRL